MPRVVSLIPSATEIVCALGREKDLVGRSHECDYPASIRKLPVCTEARIDSLQSSLAIENQVKTHLKNGLSLFKIKSDLLDQLQPDVVLTQSHCDVCAISTAEVQKQLGAKWKKAPQVISLGGSSLADVWNNVRRVAEALGVSDGGENLITRLSAQLSSIKREAAQEAERPRVLCLEWLSPLMASGNWVPELVEIAGGFDVLGKSGAHSAWTTWARVVEKDPDILIVMPCGFDINRARTEMKPLLSRPEWTVLQAVNNNRVFLVDGNQYFNRPGPRLVESTEILAEVLHPEIFDFGQKMTGWQYL